MTYLVFEAGGRAGLSAELFFVNRSNPSDGSRLVLADMDPFYRQCPGPRDVVRTGEREALEMIRSDASGLMLFPADELARQGKEEVFALASGNPLTAVEKWFYDKRRVNTTLEKATEGCEIRIPETFSLDDLFMRPNTMSAGSHGVGRLENTCITKYIEIAREYVVDVDFTGSEPKVYAREVRIKNGYDRYLKFLPSGSRIATAAGEFVKAIRSAVPLMATGIFHIQLIENPAGEIYFVEYSKRISGTSIVNLYRGFNPFDSFAGVTRRSCLGDTVREEVWYRYEDLILNLYQARI